MSASVPCPPLAREPDNELFDHGSDLVEAAAGIRRAAASMQAARAIPAVLGCIEAALEELLWAAAALEVTTANEIGEACHRSRAHRMHVGYANLQRSLADAQDASSAGRSLAARVLTHQPSGRFEM